MEGGLLPRRRPGGEEVEAGSRQVVEGVENSQTRGQVVGVVESTQGAEVVEN